MCTLHVPALYTASCVLCRKTFVLGRLQRLGKVRDRPGEDPNHISHQFWPLPRPKNNLSVTSAPQSVYFHQNWSCRARGRGSSTGATIRAVTVSRYSCRVTSPPIELVHILSCRCVLFRNMAHRGYLYTPPSRILCPFSSCLFRGPSEYLPARVPVPLEPECLEDGISSCEKLAY